MTYLQPLMLLAVPLISLPIIIHLINQRRYQTLRWGAMRFLLAANRMSRGYARIRQWLILACRTLAIAGLILAASRPLASGWLGLVSGTRPDTTLVLLDRSPSMAQTGAAGGLSKLEAATRQLVATLRQLGSTHWVLIESDRQLPKQLDSIDSLLNLPAARGSSATADLPGMLAAAAKYIANNKTGRTEIWICSDLRANDWRGRSAEWRQLRDRFAAFPQSLRFHLVAHARPAPDNLAVQVSDVQRQSSESGSELSVSLRITRETAATEPIRIPIQLEMEGARSQTYVELTGTEFDLRGHRLPIDSTLEQGWGRVSIPTDANAADDQFYFVFDKPRPRRSILVVEDPERAAALQFAAEVPPNPSLLCQAELLSPHQVATVAWEQISLVLWQAPLPAGDTADLLQRFVDRGGQVIFFPPQSPDANTFLEVGWDPWREFSQPLSVTTWTMDQDLLANTISGVALPVGELTTQRCCRPLGELTSLARLDGGLPLLGRLATTAGGVYFCGTTASPADSNLASNGAVLYVAIQRALASGAAALGQTRQTIAGKTADALGVSDWNQLAGSATALSIDYGFSAGVYGQADQLLAVNRAADEEDHAPILSTELVNGLFAGLDFSIVHNDVGSTSSLVQEIWRACLLAMIIALLVEALLCVPRAARPHDDKNPIFRERQAREAVVKDMQGAA